MLQHALEEIHAYDFAKCLSMQTSKEISRRRRGETERGQLGHICSQGTGLILRASEQERK